MYSESPNHVLQTDLLYVYVQSLIFFSKFQKWRDFRPCHENRSQNREIKIFS